MPEKLIRRNRVWSERIRSESPEYFPELAQVQRPEYLWIGCADARVPANVITGMQPGEVFVHRNVANIVHPTDLNLLSVLQFGIEGLGIRKIIVCGHYGCGGVQAATEDDPHGLVDHWIAPISQLHREHADELGALEDGHSRLNRLAELNVAQSVKRLADTPIVRAAWTRGDRVELHGMIYALSDGLLHQLDCSVTPPG